MNDKNPLGKFEEVALEGLLSGKVLLCLFVIVIAVAVYFYLKKYN
ncbi:hypothetical protein ACQ1PF_08055 [Ornithobacterium rhinotracheale]